MYYVDTIPYYYYFKYIHSESLIMLVPNSSFVVTSVVQTITGIKISIQFSIFFKFSIEIYLFLDTKIIIMCPYSVIAYELFTCTFLVSSSRSSISVSYRFYSGDTINTISFNLSKKYYFLSIAISIKSNNHNFFIHSFAFTIKKHSL